MQLFSAKNMRISCWDMVSAWIPIGGTHERWKVCDNELFVTEMHQVTDIFNSY